MSVAEITPSPSAYPRSEARPTAIGHVLVCLDRSTFSDVCLPYARFVAEAFGAKITLLHVLPSPPGAREPNRVDALEWEIAKREAAQYLSQARVSLGNAPDGTVTRLAQGFPAEQIAGAAREMGADLTILSSHGEGGECAHDLGSTAQHVLALAAGSILLAQPKCSALVPPHNILVPLDGSLRSECVLPLVANMARLHGAEVLLVHVVTDPTPTAVLTDPDDMRLAVSLASRVQANAERYLARMRSRLLREVPVVRTLVVRRVDERQALVDVAAQQGVDMLALTAHGSTCNVERAFGSVTSYLLAHAQVPLFVLQDMPRGHFDPVHPVHPVHPVPGNGARAPFSARPLEGD
jgi:nucleotide-binding universal stress UspA family protein